MQKILSKENNYQELKDYLLDRNLHNILLVCGKSISKFKINDFFNDLSKDNINFFRFDDIQPNPLYESIGRGIEVYKKNNCQAIITVGGGSIMDIAKCIKLFMYMDENICYLDQEIVENDIPFIAVPTTAGTGSEATKYAIIYYNHEKTTVTHESSIPEAVLFDSSVLNALPIYQKKATMLDALCHAIESMWAVKSNEESQKYAYEAIRLVIDNLDAYLNDLETANENMFKAANLAGKAINITSTTAGHAMCYKLTSMYDLAHGHSVGLVVSGLFPYIINNLDDYNDPRGKDYLISSLDKIAKAMKLDNYTEACDSYLDLYRKLEMPDPKGKDEDFEILTSSVNMSRLTNNPVKLNESSINTIYHRILN